MNDPSAQEMTNAQITALLREEVTPALGCTEPAAVALAAARAARELHRVPVKIEVEVSRNILKNGMGVGIPGTGRTGLHIAAALGVLAGDADAGLEVLRKITPADVDAAVALVEQGRVSLSLFKGDDLLAVTVCCFAEEHVAVAEIRGRHTGLVRVSLDNETVFAAEPGDDAHTAAGLNGSPLSVAGICRYVSEVPFPEIAFMLEGSSMNRAVAEAGLQGEWGLQVGRTMQKQAQRGLLQDELLTRVISLTAAASDLRMAGGMMAVMSNSGSGNQGITASLPVIAVAEHLKSSQEEEARALALSHLTAIHIKKQLGVLSALCGCVVAATGASAGIARLLGGNRDAVVNTINNMVGNITGMVCDGAKSGCALKVGTAAATALQSALLGIEGIGVQPTDGIVDSDVEQTLHNLAAVGSEGMRETDRMVLDIMLEKSRRMEG